MQESSQSSGPSNSESVPFMQETQYWNRRYKEGGTSGAGSYGDGLAKKLAILKPLEFSSVTEIGCGDFNFGKNIIFQNKLEWEKYFATDVSEVVIERNRMFYPRATFEVFKKGVEIPSSDLLLCVDVLFHIHADDDYNAILDVLKSLWTKYLMVTAYEREPLDHEKGSHIAIRKFDPSFFGTPKVREIVEDDGSLYAYLFEK